MSNYDLILREARVLQGNAFVDLDVGVKDGRIHKLASSLAGDALIEIAATGCQLVPGMIDAHVHFNEPGRTDWEGFATGSRAAAAGGVTTVCDMPLNSTPATLNRAAYLAKQACVEANSRIKVRLWGGLVPGSLGELADLYRCGVMGFKAFMSNSGIEEFGRADLDTLRAGMEIIRNLPGMRLAVHAEDDAMTAAAHARAAAAGRTDWRAFIGARPVAAECQAIADFIALAVETGCPAHVVHVSTAEGLALITAAKARGVDITAETCPHYLFLTEDDLETLGARAKCAPPLRSATAQAELWSALRRGEVDTIGSDHSPCIPSMKATRNFAGAWGGISGVQHSLPFLYGRSGLPPEYVARLLTRRPQQLFAGANSAAGIAEGEPADFCLLAPTPDALVERVDLLDRHQQSPYVGQPLPLTVVTTWVDGRAVFTHPHFPL